MPTYIDQIVDFKLNTKYENIPNETLDDAREVSGKPLSVLVRNGISLTNSLSNNCDPLIHSRKNFY